MPPRRKDMDVRDASVRIFILRNLLRVDWMLPIFVVALALLGFVTLYSATQGSGSALLIRQMMFFGLGSVLATIILCTDYRFSVALAPLFYVGSLALLAWVLVLADARKGSERWIDLGFFLLQPSEVAKIALIYALTWYLSKVGQRIRKLHWFLLTFVITALPMALILKQPNLGTAASLAPLTVVMLFVAGCRVRHLLALILIGSALVPYVWFEMKDFNPETEEYLAANERGKRAILEEMKKAYQENRDFYDLHWHQKMRIYTFLHPESDPRGSAWQTVQSKITVGSGGLKGKGFLKGEMTRLRYLPEHHTDFIFSTLAEERGFIGAAVVIGLFTALLLRGLIFARDCPEMMGTLLAAGVVTILAFHVFVNIGITVGLLPVTGLPLPFLSYGGSFYMATMAGVGILLSVPMRKRAFIY